MASDVAVFQFIGETVANATERFADPAAANLITALGALAIAGVTLYFVLMGYMILSGAVEQPFSNLVRQCVKIAIVSAFALNASNYATLVKQAFEGLETGLAEALVSSGPASTLYATLDASLAKGFDLVGVCIEHADQAGWNIGTALSWWITAITLGISTALVTLAGGAVIITCKFSLALLFAVGPLFIMCLLWPVTARFFDGWFAQVVNYILTVVFLAVIMAFAIEAFNEALSSATFAPGEENPLFAALEIVVLTGVLLFLVHQTGGMASALAGGISMAAMSLRQVASPVAGASGAIVETGRMLNPVSTRRDLQSGMMGSRTRLDHLVAGNTMFNSAYRRAILQNLGKGWRQQGGKVRQGKP
ncbi:MAG: type IV secretion system protein [Candidatus Accumulibacter sp.]|nr:type IV secretion system protein [Accumulibacter sp.]